MSGAATSAMEMLQKLETGNDVRQVISCSEGGRAFRLLKRREETKAKAEAEKQNIENETRKRKFSRIDQKFGASQADHLEEEFKNATVGLVSISEFRAKRKAIDDLIQSADRDRKEGKKLRLKRRVNSSKLSFRDPDAPSDEDDDDDDDEEEESASGSDDEDEPKFRKGFGKDPTVDTSFLYDAQREAAIEAKRQSIIDEYKAEQELAKREKLDITYSYWDGSGHRRNVVVEKGFTIGQFLARCKADLEKTDFPELRSVTLESLMYVKEDLIIPHQVTFFQLIKDKARGKSGPLFSFDAREDVRLVNDVRIEKDESHAGKIVDRKWYERNKHIFPASRWEMYSRDKTYEVYTVHGTTDHSRPVG